MSDSNTNLSYRPRLTGNAATDEALRIAFDYIYDLQAKISQLTQGTGK